MENPKKMSFANTTFLGGTCNETTWRDDLISLLSSKVEYFNPVIDGWTIESQLREDEAREEARYVLFVITSQMTDVFTIAEVVDCSNKRPDNTLFCVLYDGFNDVLKNSLKAVSRMVKRNGVKVFDTIEQIAGFLNSVYE